MEYVSRLFFWLYDELGLKTFHILLLAVFMVYAAVSWYIEAPLAVVLLMFLLVVVMWKLKEIILLFVLLFSI